MQSLVELAAQIAAMHVNADAGEGPVRGSNPNFRISEKTGIVAVDSSIEAVLDQVPGRPFGIIVSVTSLSMYEQACYRNSEFVLPQGPQNATDGISQFTVPPLLDNRAIPGSAIADFIDHGAIEERDDRAEEGIAPCRLRR